jgi:HEAT repeat protein
VENVLANKAKGKMQKVKFVLLFAFLACFAVNISAQNLDFLAEQIRRGSDESKRDALYQIKLIQSAEASRIAIPALQDSNEIVRATAAFAVIYLPSDEAARVLLPLLKDKSILVRKETCYALGKTRNFTALAPLVEILEKDKELEVRSAAAVGLGELGDIQAINYLVKILRNKPKENEDFLRRAAARSIGQIVQIQHFNSSYVVTPESPLPEKYDTFANLKYENLTKQFPGYREAIAVLLSVLQNTKESNDVRRESAFALGVFGDESAISTLQKNLSAEDYYLAEIAKESLLKIESAKTRPND